MASMPMPAQDECGESQSTASPWLSPSPNGTPTRASPMHELTASPQSMTPCESDAGVPAQSEFVPLEPSLASSSSSQKQTFKPAEEPHVSSPQLNSPLIVTTPSKYPDPGPRSALFGDHVAAAHVPGSLHLVPDSTIQRLVERQGYIPLIRQLAEDLAHRDRELVNFRRRAEERERALKRMLVEVEVSNVDIEKRLASCMLQRKPSRETMKSSGEAMSYTESIGEMMHQALSEEDAFSMADDTSGLNILLEDDSREELLLSRATLRVPGTGKAEKDVDSVSLNSNGSRKSATLRGWKGWIVGQGTSSSGADEESSKARRQSAAGGGGVIKRKPILPETFSPPLEATSVANSISQSNSRASLVSLRSSSVSFAQTSGRAIPAATIYTQHHFAADQSHPNPPSQPDSETGSSMQRRQSNSVAHWALRLVSQPPPVDPPENGLPTSPTRPRSRSTPDGALDGKRRGSMIAADPLQRSKTRNVIPNARGRAPSTTFFQDIRGTAERIVPLGGSSQNSSSKKNSDGAGPVEMDMIIPHEAQPPTLLQGWNQKYPNDFLTDRFGFIYDKQQRSVSINGANSIEGSYTERKPSEESSVKSSSHVAVGDTIDALPELTRLREVVYGPSSFSNVPAPAPTPGPQSRAHVEGGKISSRTPLVGRLSRPGAAISSPTPATNAISEAPLAIRPQMVSSASTAEESTVRLLLGQLSDLHDSLQRDRTLKWNEFLRKVRVERRRGEDEEKGMPETLMADGELIGVATLGTEGRGGKQRWREFKSLVLGGIPVAYRWKIWTECSGATAMKVPGYYDDLLQSGHDDPIVISQIAMDINRTLTDNIFFRKGPGVSKLKQVLLAYSRRNQEVGYCQGMNMIAASLLLIMPSEEDAFWVLCSIVERILPKTYFEPNLLASRADQEVLKHYVAAILPSLHMHLMGLGVELEALTFQWFLSIFTDTLAAEALFRVWDVILCVAGSVFLFQVGIALLRLNEKALLQCGSAAEVYSYLNGGMIHQGISIDGLIRESDVLRNVIRKLEVEKRRERAVEKELGERGVEVEEGTRKPLTAIVDDGGEGEEEGGVEGGDDGISPIVEEEEEEDKVVAVVATA